MARSKIFEIPGKLTVEWDDEVRAIVDTWTNYSVSVQEFQDAVLNRGLKHAAMNGGAAYIVDSSQARGTFSPEIQAAIEKVVFPAFSKNGIKYFITILSSSSITNMGIQRYSASAGPAGLQVVVTDGIASAKDWLRGRKAA